jgi:hypothetical protein
MKFLPLHSACRADSPRLLVVYGSRVHWGVPMDDKRLSEILQSWRDMQGEATSPSHMELLRQVRDEERQRCEGIVREVGTKPSGASTPQQARRFVCDEILRRIKGGE